MSSLASHPSQREVFHPRLEQPPKVKFSSSVPFLYLKNKHPNLAFLSSRLTSFDSSISKLFGTKVILPWWCNCNYVMGTRCCELSAPRFPLGSCKVPGESRILWVELRARPRLHHDDMWSEGLLHPLIHTSCWLWMIVVHGHGHWQLLAWQGPQPCKLFCSSS